MCWPMGGPYLHHNNAPVCKMHALHVCITLSGMLMIPSYDDRLMRLMLMSMGLQIKYL